MKCLPLKDDVYVLSLILTIYMAKYEYHVLLTLRCKQDTASAWLFFSQDKHFCTPEF